MSIISKIFGTKSDHEIKRIKPYLDRINQLEEEYRGLSNDALRGKTAEFKTRLAAGETLDDLLPEAFATVREASGRVLGMRHYDVQLLGGIILHQGRISEMRTGEGKTLVATLPAYLNALAGEGVHIVTVNDYLAKRDSEWMGKLYRYMGLSVGLVVHEVPPAERAAAYAADITYGTNNEFGFDYLRDNMVTYKKSMVQRGHSYAIVDEVDSILIDEARTPLIISGKGDESTELYRRANDFVRSVKCTKLLETDQKKDSDEYEGDFVCDEKAKSCVLTSSGVEKAERFFGLENLADAENSEIMHHINQAMKANAIMKRDVDYVVKDGEIIIVDEFTGRMMFGRRFSDGLHQAIEAKEKVSVKSESKTLATITFQNYFRMYKKLAGMTGTALTEEPEFREIYGLDVIEIPTNKPMIREDHSDVVYKTEAAKFKAVCEEIRRAHEKGQPVLVGTISIEKSEELSKLLRGMGVKHEVLNAKAHAKEAQIVAQAGKKGAVTIATNMAGRGTDIILGGNAEYMAKEALLKDGLDEELVEAATGLGETDDEELIAARSKFAEYHERFKAEIREEAEEVRRAGGLFIIGTERHESRRIDNQLRGRSGRQGDPGESRFFLSLEDDLMRLFGGDRMTSLVDTLKLGDDVPIEAKMLSGSIENAQKRVEMRNFETRKYVLQYDNVMNEQRKIIYEERRRVLDGEDMNEKLKKYVSEVIADEVKRHAADGEVDVAGVKRRFLGLFLTEDDLRYTPEQLEDLSPADVERELGRKAEAAYKKQEETFGENMRELERIVVLQSVDTHWMNHIDDMDELKKGIGLRSMGKDPVVEYKFESFDMFDTMVASIKEDAVDMIFRARLRKESPLQRKQVLKPSEGGSGAGPKTPVKRSGQKVGRNDPCPCGSGLKYKKCCGR